MIYHIAPRTDWERALNAGGYASASLATEGFIHCSTRAQVLGVASAIFGGREDLVLLCIDEAKVAAEIRFEAAAMVAAAHEAGQRFPHIYGALNLAGVVDVVPFPPNTDGSFSLPRPLTGSQL